MKIIDCDKLENNLKVNTNICIVGSGAAGSVLAIELSKTNKEITMIESGKKSPNSKLQSLNELDYKGIPFRKNFQNRIRQYGGACNIWPGRTMVLSPLDISKRSWIENSEWPLSREELYKYYSQATNYLGISDINDYNYKNWMTRINRFEKTLFKSPIIKPTISLWGKKTHRFGMGSKDQKYLEKQKNVSIYTNSTLNDIILNDSKTNVLNIKARSINDKEIMINAKIFILACGGIENARLLLTSNKQFVNGIGNENDNVGRYFMEHPKIVNGRVHLNKKIPLPNVVGSYFNKGKMKIGFSLNDNIQKEKGLLNCYTAMEPKVSDSVKKSYALIIQTMKRLLRKGYSGRRLDKHDKIAKIPDIIYELPPMDLMPHFIYKYYDKIKKLLINTVTDSFVMINYCEQEPNPNSRILLSRERDFFGVNKIIMDWKIGNKEIMSIREIQKSINNQFKNLNYGYIDKLIDTSEIGDFSDASHHMGTTRISLNPQKGVVDLNCKVHSIDNLFIGGSSVFPTSGHANPTLTIVALSIRLANYIKKLNL